MTPLRSGIWKGLAAVLVLTLAGPAAAQLGDLLKAPKTLIDRAIDARSSADIVTDNRIVLDVNAIMADLGTVKASTEIKEQRLLVTGVFDDRALYDRFRLAVERVKGVKRLSWHALYMDKAEQARRKAELLGWDDVLLLDGKVDVNMVSTRGVADVNFRVAVDSLATVYLIGRARSGEEMNKAVRVARATEGVRRLVNYVEVRP